MSAEVFQQFEAMVAVLRHMTAGYRVFLEARGEDGADGYSLETEQRNGGYFEVTEATIPLVCVAAARKLRP